MFVYSGYFNDEPEHVKHPALGGNPFETSEPFFEMAAQRWEHYILKNYLKISLNYFLI